MKIKQICCLSAAVMIFCTNAANAEVAYLPNVTKEMSRYSFWSEDSELLMSYDEIKTQNEKTISQSDTHMYDLKNQPDFVDGIALNEALKKSSEEDAKYYLGWTYIESNQKAEQKDFDEFISNTQNPNPKSRQNVMYAVATRHTELMAFPSEKPIWDDPADKDFDYQYLSGVRVNEPLVITSVSADGRYYLAKNVCCSGWVSAEDIAICQNREEWLSAWDISNENALVVTGDRVYTQVSNTSPNTSDLMLTMGTVLRKAYPQNPNELIDNRAAYQNYAVWIPIRNDDGSYAEKMALIPEHNKVSDGYLAMTKANIAEVALSALGNAYGWGGSLLSDDCSGYIRNIYKCFGLELARNTTWQAAMPMTSVDMKYMCREEREMFLDSMPVGTILYFSGHEMMYLGKCDSDYYVISSVSAIMQPENETLRQRIRSIVINTLDIKRGNGNSWLEDLTLAIVPFLPQQENLPQNMWYHDGVGYLIKNGLAKGDDDGYFNPNNNVTWAEFLQILLNGEENADKEAQKSENWYDAALSFAKEKNLIYEEDVKFSPEENMTREEIVSVLYRYAQYKKIDTTISENADLERFGDAAEISAYALPAMKYAISCGIVSGKTDATLNPKDCTTRAETAVMIKGFFEKIK